MNETREPFQSFKPGGNAFFHARLAANCCVALGKAHCAAVHTEGDLVGSFHTYQYLCYTCGILHTHH